MKLTVLLDNNTLIDRYFLGEPGVSYLLETDGRRILFDTGYSDAFIKNAEKLRENLLDIDFLVLSHGHIDHTGGLDPLVKLFMERSFEDLSARSAVYKKPVLVTHPDTFLHKSAENGSGIGSLLTTDTLSLFFRLKLSSEPIYITERMVFLGEIERKNNFEAKKPIGKILKNGTELDDYLLDDSALVYISEKGLVIITGCSHSGICNIIEYAKKVTGKTRIADVIGGFHLLNPSGEQMEGTVRCMRNLKPDVLHACHCTDLHSKMELARAAELEEAGTGFVLEY